MPEERNVVVGSWASYLDTGIWDIEDGQVIAPETLTVAQLKDHLLVCGGAVYLREDGKLCWFNKGTVVERSSDA